MIHFVFGKISFINDLKIRQNPCSTSFVVPIGCVVLLGQFYNVKVALLRFGNLYLPISDYFEILFYTFIYL